MIFLALSQSRLTTGVILKFKSIFGVKKYISIVRSNYALISVVAHIIIMCDSRTTSSRLNLAPQVRQWGYPTRIIFSFPCVSSTNSSVIWQGVTMLFKSTSRHLFQILFKKVVIQARSLNSQENATILGTRYIFWYLEIVLKEYFYLIKISL